MKKYIVLSAIGLSVFAVSCGANDDLSEKKSELSEKKEKMQELKVEIKALEDAIAAADPSFGKSVRDAQLVSTLAVKKDDFNHFVEVSGEVQSKKNVTISAQTLGRIVSIPAKEGEQVQKGQVLVNIDADVLRNNIDEVKTQLELALTVFERQKNLWDQNIGTEIQFLEAKNRKESLERQLATLQSQLNQSVVRAPFSGTVEEVMVRQGEMASTGAPLVRLVSLEDMYLRSEVSEVFIGRFNKGDKVEVTFPSLSKTYETRITAVGQVINPANRTFSIEATLPEDAGLLRPNLLAVLKIKDFEEKNALLVPTNLIQRDRRGEYVYVVEQEGDVLQVKKKHIETGMSYNNETLVRSGLDAGDLLVNEGFREVNDGVNVKVINESVAKS